MPIAIAPWLRPTDVLGSIQAGVHAGLSLRAQEQAAQEAQANREERAQLAADSLKERTLLSSMRMLELAADRAERAGYHKESVKAREAADALNATYHQGLLAASSRDAAQRASHNAAMEKAAQQNADTNLAKSQQTFSPKVITVEGKRLIFNEKTGHFIPIEDTDKNQAGTLLSGIKEFQTLLATPGATQDQKNQAGASLKALQDRYNNLMNLPTVTPAIPARWDPQMLNPFHHLPGTPAVTNFPPRSASAALQPPPGPPANIQIAPPSVSTSNKQLTPDMAAEFFRVAEGDAEKARAMAKEAGYQF